MLERRKVELKSSSAQDLFDKVNGWMKETFGITMPKRALSVVTITDPIWVDSEEIWRKSHGALKAGYTVGWERPQFCILAYEGEFVQ